MYGRRLLLGEKAALEAGGCVVRLVGLYHSVRGAHTFFLRAGEVARWGGYIINLIHYEDAASLCVAVCAPLMGIMSCSIPLNPGVFWLP